MGLSIDELDLQSTEYLPAREVMSSLNGGPGLQHNDQTGVANTDVNVQNVNLGIIQDVNVFKGEDSDAVDVDSFLKGIL
jgi:hypothetical protein